MNIFRACLPFLSAALALLSALAFAAAPPSGTIEVRAYAEATPPGADVGAAYLDLRNVGKSADRLLRVTTPAAGSTMMHQSLIAGGMAKMTMLDSVALPPGGEVRFAPGAMHLMLEALKRPLKAGDRVPLTLEFEHSPPLTIEATVRGPDSGASSF